MVEQFILETRFAGGADTVSRGSTTTQSIKAENRFLRETLVNVASVLLDGDSELISASVASYPKRLDYQRQKTLARFPHRQSLRRRTPPSTEHILTDTAEVRVGVIPANHPAPYRVHARLTVRGTKTKSGAPFADPLWFTGTPAAGAEFFIV